MSSTFLVLAFKNCQFSAPTACYLLLLYLPNRTGNGCFFFQGALKMFPIPVLVVMMSNMGLDIKTEVNQGKVSTHKAEGSASVSTSCTCWYAGHAARIK